MSVAGDHYRRKALELFAKAETETTSEMKAEFEHLAIAFTRLADQADRNSQTDVSYEPPLPKLNEPEIER
jgi:hypothetical protein